MSKPSTETKNDKFELIVLVLILVGFVAAGISTLTRGHVWLDDFAGYVMQAISIINGDMRDFISHNTLTINNSSFPPGPIAYPWGFPLMLVPIIAFFGNNPLALKLVNIFFYSIFLFFIFLLAKTRLKTIDSLLITAVFAFLPVMVKANDYIISDIPFLAVSTIALYSIDKLYKYKYFLVISGLLVFIAFFIRVNGILLFVPLIISIFFREKILFKKKILTGLIPISTFIILFLIQYLIFPGGQSSYFTHFSLFSFEGILNNVIYYLFLPVHLFDELPFPNLFYLISIIFFVISFLMRLKRNISLIAYLLSTILLLIFWPERQGLRFIYPVLPILLIMAFEGTDLAAEFIKAKWKKELSFVFRIFWISILCLSLFVTVPDAYNNLKSGRVINGPYDSYSREMFKFIIEKTPVDSVYIFMRPRAFRLFTGRDSFMSDQCSDLLKGDYIILHQKMNDMGQIDPQIVNSCNTSIKLTEIFTSKRFVVYQISY